MHVTLSNNGAFALTDEEGNMTGKYHGFYSLDTRFVRKAILHVKPEPEFIGASSTFREGVSYFSIGDEGILVRRRTLDGSYSEELSIYNASERTLSVGVLYTYEAPIEDIFQVRGFMGLKEEVALRGKGFYSRSVGSERRTLRVESNLTRKGESLRTKSEIPPGGKASFFVRFVPGMRGKTLGMVGEGQITLENTVFTGSVTLDGIFERALENLRALTLSTIYGPVPLAGLPYFACPFGRDAIITSLFLLPYYPDYARGTLRFFASIQGKEYDKLSEEEPGKIPHEFRLGELAQSGKVPFGPYYGTVDATPLYVALAGEYLRWSGDEKLIGKLRPSITRAVEWILKKLRKDRYITYVPGILGNKGWKDSGDAIVDENGKPAKPPIALVEVQGYAYWALKLAGELGLTELDSGMLLGEAEKLRKMFNRDFWVDGYYTLALDGDGKALRVVSSNMGHLLLTGIAEHGEEVAERLFKPDMLSRHGIRTLSSKEKAYNPFSYHRGSVWPHDNALIALGLARIGSTDLAKELAERIFETAKMPWGELPELYSGLDELVPVPRANSPQAWSAASVFALVTASLGMEAGERLTVWPAEGVNFLVRVTFRGWRYMIQTKGGVEVEPL